VTAIQHAILFLLTGFFVGAGCVVLAVLYVRRPSASRKPEDVKARVQVLEQDEEKRMATMDDHKAFNRLLEKHGGKGGGTR
jgi:hypothetical protein